MATPGLEPQSIISDEIAAEDDKAGFDIALPRLDYRPYRSSQLRHPTKDLEHTDPEAIEMWAPCFGHWDVDPLEADLTLGPAGEAMGERVNGHVVLPVGGQ
ncbi:hypothetical protein [Streptomyces prasinus]